MKRSSLPQFALLAILLLGTSSQAVNYSLWIKGRGSGGVGIELGSVTARLYIHSGYIRNTYRGRRQAGRRGGAWRCP